MRPPTLKTLIAVGATALLGCSGSLSEGTKSALFPQHIEHVRMETHPLVAERCQRSHSSIGAGGTLRQESVSVSCRR